MNRAFHDGLCQTLPDQAIVNEYQPGQGISNHIDCSTCFGNTVLSISLLSPVMMEFKHNEHVQHVWIEPRSLLVMQDEARYLWTDGIAKRKSDVVDGERLERGRRISITLREVLLTRSS